MPSGKAEPMAKKTPIDKLSAEVGKILADYGQDVYRNLSEATKRVAKAGAKAVSQSAKATFGGTGTYAAGWSSKLEDGRLSTQGIIYNKDVPGMPHLLENGHAKRGGGRVSGRAHIAPVEEKLIKDLEEAVKAGL